ncbi:MAG: (2Fe-2S) ferredoxin domain-containing protein [Chloroflexota bacterium]
MTLIHSMQDLERAREEALARQRAQGQQHRFHLRVGLGSCSIAAGAQDTLDALTHMVAAEELEQVLVTKTGCIGQCALEPIVQVQERDKPPITYGKVTPDIARRILKEHIGSGMVVQQYTIETV